MADKISQKGLNLIMGFEGFVSHAYWDPYGKVWTIGYGQTRGVTSSTGPWTQKQAEANLIRSLATEYEPAIHALGVTLNQNQYDSVCSTIYNGGPGWIAAGTQLGDLLRKREWAAYAHALLAYDTSGGVVLSGLATRRQTEAALFLSTGHVAQQAVKLVGGIAGSFTHAFHLRKPKGGDPPTHHQLVHRSGYRLHVHGQRQKRWAALIKQISTHHIHVKHTIHPHRHHHRRIRK